MKNALHVAMTRQLKCTKVIQEFLIRNLTTVHEDLSLIKVLTYLFV